MIPILPDKGTDTEMANPGASAAMLTLNVDRVSGGSLNVQLYEQLLATYPDYEKNDLVLYQLARAHEIDGQTDEALLTLDRLVHDYPGTPHYTEAHFRRGETLFVHGRYDEAEQAYAAAFHSGDPQFREQSLYKRGWSLFKQQRHEASFDSFFSLLDGKLLSSTNPAAAYAAMGRAEQELVADTLRVLSISFSYLSGPQSISEYFATNGTPAYAYIIYSTLGELYLENERYQDTAAAYGAFAERYSRQASYRRHGTSLVGCSPYCGASDYGSRRGCFPGVYL